ncbi:hypothetical protein G6F46_006842 [Rhizopus delemar]|uniref:Uncharacterized protein n=2 Tax=Rhizopus TaxID=4842 RepID=A0A9P6Z3H2_9FUNG|nr:hypothetical protein G6F55_005500 [Rhizopus delemar]KAG1542991.1 hypothetical protein G6F51_006947 [Rhizopus arrhizus]KAG1505021.1 hypothetical protein G6F54_000593 [Rhizopus delemar]KAG1510637.1 hypothetical protein G6F53_006533 [Rhizopus delemar]KAG1526033.1 hypothetical protein G6F52_002801 [Rhizopus delemar]
MLFYRNNLPRSHQAQTSHLLHLDAPRGLPVPLSIVVLPTYQSAPSPNNATPSPPKTAKLKRDNTQPSLTAMTKQFSSSPEPTGFKLIHITHQHPYEAEIRSQLCKFNIIVRDDFDPLDPSIIRDPTFINQPINCKIHRARKAFLHRICIALQRLKTPIYNIISNFFLHFELISFKDLASYDLAPPYKYSTGHILGRA